jgi:hypothetical protein
MHMADLKLCCAFLVAVSGAGSAQTTPASIGLPVVRVAGVSGPSADPAAARMMPADRRPSPAAKPVLHMPTPEESRIQGMAIGNPLSTGTNMPDPQNGRSAEPRAQ